MSKNLLIVESPSKARTIKKYLGKDFTVLASVGHIKDLPTKELGVDVENRFQPKYVTVRGKTKIIKQLRDSAKKADNIYLAPDPDREGEAIAWHISNTIKVSEDKIHRVLFNEITKNGVKQGIKNPRQIDTNLVNAQQARRILDRLVGYQVSPFLWKTLYRGLSAGRVQSVAVRIICAREEEVENFQPMEYWLLFADLETPGKEQFRAKCIKIKGKKPKISDEKSAKECLDILKNADFTVQSVIAKDVKKSPSPPFTTSTLQQTAMAWFRYPPRRTMQIAQQLYEGIEINGEPVGLITYMRTDSVRISSDATAGVRDFISSEYGAEYIPAKPRYFKSKKKNVQDAHEGIRPTRFDLPPDKIKKNLSPDQYKLYRMIWNRFAACQCSVARYKQKTIDIEAEKFIFRAQGSTLVFDGFLKIWRDNKTKQENEEKLPAIISENDKLSLLELKPEQKFTQPPPRFSEGTLVKELDTLGIGRPSTYATIVSTIIQRKYIERKTGYLIPTVLGKTVNKILLNGMSEIINIEFTGKMEDELDEIESDNKNWLDVLDDFYQPFKKYLDEMNSRRKEIKENLQEKTEEKCERCNSPLIIKWSKNGRFLACSSFPECKYTRPLHVETGEKIVTKKTCPKCNSEMALKEGRYGKFWACTKYPECNGTLPFSLEIQCPDCSGEIVVKTTRKGKTFFGCSEYPKCKFATWNEPINRKCTNCGYSILEKRIRKNRGEAISCPKCKTEFSPEEK